MLFRRAMALAFVGMLAASVAACSSGAAAAEVVVTIDAQACVGAAARSAHVRVWSNEGMLVLDRSVSLVPGAMDATQLPLHIPIVPIAGDTDRRFWLEATLIDAHGNVFDTVRVAGSYLAQDVGAITACFADACLDLDCGACAIPMGETGAGLCNTCDPQTRTCGDATVRPVRISEARAACPPRAGESGAQCIGGADEDCDGRIDCMDTDCAHDAVCAHGEICGNSIDDDGDTLADCADGDCSSSPGCAHGENCTNAVDDDGDGQVDCADAECAHDPACAHGEAGGLCHNSVDDDMDGLVDCNEPDCHLSGGLGENCIMNTADEDCDGAIDGADSECDGRQCNAGAEWFRWCNHNCMSTRDDNHCGGCDVACVGGAHCQSTNLADQHARCGCPAPGNACPGGFSCNTSNHLCNCSPGACGAGMMCNPTAGSLPGYCG